MTQKLILNSVTNHEFLQLAHHFSKHHEMFLLYSGTSLDSAQFSYLALFPFETLKIEEDRYTLWQGNSLLDQGNLSPWDALDQWEQTLVKQNPEQMAFGWLSYEMGYFADPDQKLSCFQSHLPLAYWQRHIIVATLNHALKQLTIQINQEKTCILSDEEKSQVHSLSTLFDWQLLLKNAIYKKQIILTEVPQIDRKQRYLNHVKKIKEWIYEGEIYQVNLSHSFYYKGDVDSFSLFCHLNQLNPAPFSAYIKQNSWNIISSSPERFLKKTGQFLETRPIKGTIKRGKNLKEDQKNKHQLLYSAKEQAELLMITDLMRNDLGKISQIGSVKVPELRRCEAYTNVFHLLSIIQSQVFIYLTPFKIIQNCFPGGSITGCPKLRAMEVIHQLENEARGIYTGSIGYLTGTGDFDLNIAIRTVIQTQELLHLKLGSGIVIDSDALQEYLETLAKGASIFKTLNSNISYEQ